MKETRTPRVAIRDRRARCEASLLLVAIALGCPVAIFAIPTALLWALTQAISSTIAYLVAAMVTIPIALIAAVWVLVAVNRRYLLVKHGSQSLAEDEEIDWRRPGPLESILPASVILAVIGLVLWLAVFGSHLPAGREQLIP